MIIFGAKIQIYSENWCCFTCSTCLCKCVHELYRRRSIMSLSLLRFVKAFSDVVYDFFLLGRLLTLLYWLSSNTSFLVHDIAHQRKKKKRVLNNSPWLVFTESLQYRKRERWERGKENFANALYSHFPIQHLSSSVWVHKQPLVYILLNNLVAFISLVPKCLLRAFCLRFERSAAVPSCAVRSAQPCRAITHFAKNVNKSWHNFALLTIHNL